MCHGRRGRGGSEGARLGSPYQRADSGREEERESHQRRERGRSHDQDRGEARYVRAFTTAYIQEKLYVHLSTSIILARTCISRSTYRHVFSTQHTVHVQRRSVVPAN